MDMGPWFEVLFETLEKPGNEPTTPDLQGEWLNPYTMEVSYIIKLGFTLAMLKYCKNEN